MEYEGELLVIDGAEVYPFITAPQWLAERAPNKVGAFQIIPGSIEGAFHYLHKPRRMTLIFSAMLEHATSRRWLHLSIAKKDQMPTYDDLASAKGLFIPDLVAYQLFVPVSEHVNIHPFALHLWACIDGPVTPDFRIARLGI